MPTYSVKVLKEGRTLTRKQIVKGLVKTEVVVIKAGPDQAYVISDALLESKAPTKIQTRRVGQDLHLSIGGSAIDAPDLIIEQYFAFPPAPFLGTLSDGTNVTYDMNQIVALVQEGLVPQVAETASGRSVSSTSESKLDDPQPYAGMSGLQLIGAIGLGGLVLAAAGNGDKSTAPTAAQAAQTKINTFAGDSSQPAPTVADYGAVGVIGVTAANVLAINSAVDALSPGDVGSLAKLQFIVDAYTKILAEANGPTADATPGNNPTAALYSAIGVTLGATVSDPENLSLLNSVVGEKTAADVDSIAEINAIVDAVNAVMTCAAGGATPTLQQLALLNVVGVTTDNLALVLAAIAATSDSGTGVDTLAKLQAVVDAKIGITTFNNYASGISTVAPTLADYTQANVTGVTSTNLSAINSAIDALDAPNVNTTAKVQAIVDAYNKILAEANGSAPDATPAINPSAQDYAKIGANIDAASTSATNLALLNDVIANKVTADVDTIAEINEIALAVNAVMVGAVGGIPPTVAQLALLGLTGINSENIAVIQARIAATNDDGTGVDSLVELQAIINNSFGLTTITNYAANSANGVPTLADYTQTTVVGVTSGNLSAINSAVDALAASDVNTLTKLQAVVDAYLKILAEANGPAPDATPTSNPLASDYAAIGATAGLAATNTYALSLLNGIVGGLNSTAVDTIVEINGLGQIVDKLMTVAAGGVASLTVTDFNTIGIATAGSGAVSSVNLNAVVDAIANAGGQSHIGGLVELQTLVGAVATIVSYADSNTNAAPTVSTYANAGLSGVTSVNLAAINSAADANAVSGVDTKTEMQALIDAYTFILAEANGAASDATPGANPTIAQYTAIGASIGSAASHVESLQLLNDAVASLTITSVDTVAEINALAATVDKIMNLAALPTGSAIPTGVPSMAELTALGLNTTLANTVAEQNAIWQAIIDSNNSGTGVMTIIQLQALIDAHSS